MINTRLTRLAEGIYNLIDNSTFFFPQVTRTPITDIAHYPFTEKPLFLFIYHPLQLIDIICRQRCNYPIGHVASIYQGVCIDSSSDFFKTFSKKGFFGGLKEAFQKWYNGRNTSPIGSTLRRIVKAEQRTKPFIFLLFPQKMGLDPTSLKEKMMRETMLVDDYCFLGNNCATHVLRPILGKSGIKNQFGNVITAKETLCWCDNLCDENKAVRVSSTGLAHYLSNLDTNQPQNLFGEKTNTILTHYLKSKHRD